MTRDDFEQMWGGDPYSKAPHGPNTGCIMLMAVAVAVWMVIGVGIWWVVTR